MKPSERTLNVLQEWRIRRVWDDPPKRDLNMALESIEKAITAAEREAFEAARDMAADVVRGEFLRHIRIKEGIQYDDWRKG